MRTLLVSLSIVAILLSACVKTPTPGSDRTAAPSAASIEKLIRGRLKKDDVDRPGLFPFENAVLMDFRLVDLEQVSSSRWRAEIGLLIDYGPAPPSVIGFERIRLGLFKVRLDRQDANLELTRLTPVGTVQPLPGAA